MNILKRLRALNPFRKKNILFVCTGNTCRSPMAEKLLQMKLGLLGRRRYVVFSAGTAANDGDSASENAQKALATIGLDLSKHQSRKVTAKMANNATLVVALTKRHAEAVKSLAPDANVITIDDRDICDPFHGSELVYNRCAQEIGAALDKLVQRL